MLNNYILVGRIAENIEIKEIEGKKVGILKVSVPRCFKNTEGDYDVDIIDLEVYDNIAENVSNYCKKGDVVGAKGRISKLEGEELKLVVEKVTFLSSKKNEEDDF